jgi:hypothetical protein
MVFHPADFALSPSVRRFSAACKAALIPGALRHESTRALSKPDFYHRLLVVLLIDPYFTDQRLPLVHLGHDLRAPSARTYEMTPSLEEDQLCGFLEAPITSTLYGFVAEISVAT